MIKHLLKILKPCPLLIASLIITVNMAAQNTAINGVVKDAAGSPIIGVSVTLDGTTIGTATSADGSYTLRFPANDQAVITFKYLGYVSKSVHVGSQTTIDVVLEEDAMRMDDLVVIGYGSITKRSLSTAVSSIDGDALANMPTSNIAQSLVGLSSGISFQQVSGQPGSAPAIRIRGAGSINSGNDPLYVIDGMPTTDSELFTNLNPNDVQDIQILKDAAASAIYGSRAGNGVIIVSTKKGEGEGKAKISFSTQVGISQVQKFVDVLNADQFLDMIIEARTNNGTIGSFQNLIDLRNSGNYENTDWQKEVFRNAANYRASLNITGGTGSAKYNFSANYQNEEGILLNSFNERIGVKGGFEAKLGKYVSLGASFAPTYNYTRSQNPSGGNTDLPGGIVAQALTMAPILPVYQPNGDYTQVPQHYSTYGLNTQINNPVSNLLEYNRNSYSLRSVNNVYINIKPIQGLVINSSLNATTNSQKGDFYRSPYINFNRTGNKSTPNLNGIDANRTAGFGYNLYWSTTATYDWTMKDVHHFNVVAGYDAEYNSGFNITQSTRTDKDYPYAFSNSNITNVNGANLWNGSSSFTEYAFDALFGRVNYDFNNKYVLSASIRRDRSSKFGPDNRAGIFYSGSAAWNISEEPWAKTDWLSIAKVRLSYGLTGNDQIGNNYAWISSLSNNHNVVFGNSTVKGYYSDGYSNRDLGWETNKQWDLGIDIGVFNRINMTVDLYKRNSDVVMSASIPNFNGIAGSISMNSGEIENKGIEIQLTSTILNKTEFKWKTNLNWSKNINKIVSLSNNQTQLSNQGAGPKWGNVIRNYIGRPMGDMYMLKVIGTFNNAEDLANNAKNGTQAIGDLMYENVDGNNKIDTNDYQYVGNYQPDFTFGWSNNFAYKNFDLVVTMDGQVGGNIIYAAARAFTLNRYDDNVLAESGLGRWQSEENPGNGTSHKAGTNNLGSNIIASTRYLYKSDFLRIRNVSLGYSFSKNICQKVGLQGMRLSLNVQNLYTFCDYPGYSVESNYQGNSATNNGVDFGSYPASRVMTLGLNINF